VRRREGGGTLSPRRARPQSPTATGAWNDALLRHSSAWTPQHLPAERLQAGAPISHMIQDNLDWT
jgi:hypothetical protein